MKKLINWLLVLCMGVALLTGCGASDSQNESVADDTDTAEEEAVVEETAVEDSAEDAAAEPEEAEESETEESIHIGLAASTMESEYWIGVCNSVTEAAEAANVELDITSAGTDLAQQIKDIENLITMGCNYILLDPVDAVGIVDCLNQARAEGVKVITFGTTPEDPDCYDIALKADQTTIGDTEAELAAEWVEATFPDAEPGSIQAAIFGAWVRTDDIDRCDALRNITNYTDKVTIVEEYDIGFDNFFTKNQEDTDMMLQAYPDVKVILSYATAYALPIDEVLQRTAGVDVSSIGVFGIDKDEVGLQKIVDSGSNASCIRGVAYSGEDIGSLLLDVVLGKTQPEEGKMIAIPIDKITIDNVQDYLTE